MNIVDLLHRKKIKNKPAISFDTIGSGEAYTIRRESDDVEQSFTYEQVLDGTYDTFVSGSFGAIKEWKSNLLTLSQITKTSQIRLISNSGTPYLDDYDQDNALYSNHNLNISGDWIFSFILKDEMFTGSQRVNFGIRGTGNNFFGININTTGIVRIAIDNLTTMDKYISSSVINAFSLYTFSRIGGVFKGQVNNIEKTQTPDSYSMTVNISENQMVLGARGLTGDLGKITKYRHLGILTGTGATNTDLNEYNQSIMTKYSV